MASALHPQGHELVPRGLRHLLVRVRAAVPNDVGRISRLPELHLQRLLLAARGRVVQASPPHSARASGEFGGRRPCRALRSGSSLPRCIAKVERNAPWPSRSSVGGSALTYRSIRWTRTG